MLTALFACTAGINLMALTGPAYMVVLYDRVLNTRDAQYLVGMTALMLVLYALGAGLDIVRHGVLLRCAQRTDRTLSMLLLGKRGNARAIADLDRLRAILGGHAPAALCDLPWVPLYLCVLFLLHPLFGTARGNGRRPTCRVLDHCRATQCGSCAAGGTIERAAVCAAHLLKGDAQPGGSWSTRACARRRMPLFGRRSSRRRC